MRRLFRFDAFLILSISLGCPSVSFAGPIEWSYTSTFHAVGQPSVPYLFLGDGGTGAGGTYVLGATLQGLNELGFPSNPGIGSLITVGHYEISQLNAAYQSPPTTQKSFELDVIVTDGASGQMGTAAFFGIGNTVFTEDWIPNPISLRFTSSTKQTLVLGANRYELDVLSTAAMPGGNGDVFAAVTIESASTPEPGTLALAGVGMTGLFGLRRWR